MWSKERQGRWAFRAKGNEIPRFLCVKILRSSLLVRHPTCPTTERNAWLESTNPRVRWQTRWMESAPKEVVTPERPRWRKRRRWGGDWRSRERRKKIEGLTCDPRHHVASTLAISLTQNAQWSNLNVIVSLMIKHIRFYGWMTKQTEAAVQLWKTDFIQISNLTWPNCYCQYWCQRKKSHRKVPSPLRTVAAADSHLKDRALPCPCRRGWGGHRIRGDVFGGEQWRSQGNVLGGWAKVKSRLGLLNTIIWLLKLLDNSDGSRDSMDGRRAKCFSSILRAVDNAMVLHSMVGSHCSLDTNQVRYGVLSCFHDTRHIDASIGQWITRSSCLCLMSTTCSFLLSTADMLP
jgi:hypothetical protein